jgi:hypothetical protein
VQTYISMKYINTLLFIIALCLVQSYYLTKTKTGLKAKLLTKDSPSSGCIWAYEHCNYGGTKKEYCKDANLDSFAYAASSIKLGADTIVTLYSEKNQAGAFRVIESDISCLVDVAFNDKTVSVKLSPKHGCGWFYKDCDYEGSVYRYCSDQNSVSANDAFSSVKLGPQTVVTLYKDSEYRGSTVRLINDITCLKSISFNDVTSSLKFERQRPNSGCIFAYQDCDYFGNVKTYCSDQSSLSDFNNVISSIRVGDKTELTLFDNASFSGFSFTTLDDSSCLTSEYLNDRASSLKIGSITQTGKLLHAVRLFSPVTYFESKEEHFPCSVEDLSITWPTDLTNKDNIATYNYNAGSSVSAKAPYYVKIKNDGTGFKLVFVVVYAYNACGPEFSITAGVWTNVGKLTGSIDDSRISVCPAGVHNGDIEHSIVYLDSNLIPYKVETAYHEWDTTTKTSDLGFDGSHPVIYAARGSHAGYPASGDQFYKKIWDESSGTDSTCGATCTWNYIPYPCTKSCWIGAKTNAYLVDNVGKTTKWDPPIRVIASEAFTVTYVTSNEDKFMQFKGRFGTKINNNAWNSVKSSVLSAVSVIKPFCSSCYTKASNGLDSLDDYYNGEAPVGLGGKDFW